MTRTLQVDGVEFRRHLLGSLGQLGVGQDVDAAVQRRVLPGGRERSA